MGNTVDARGLSCPQPVLDTLTMIGKAGSGTILVMVDTEAAKENVSRAAAGKGWLVDGIVEKDDEYHITLKSG